MKLSLLIIPALTFQLFTTVNDFNKQIPQPVQIKEDIVRTKARYALEELNAPPDRMNRLINAVHAGHIASNGIDPILIATIFRPESDYKINAVSKAGYAGLMGTPKKKNIPRWEYAETNVVYGSQILRDKISESNGDLDKAMIHYKGHGGKESQKYAAQQMQLYREIKSRVEKRMKG